MIELYQFLRNDEGFNFSPFCLKVQAFLEITDLNYREVQGSPLQAPVGKLPYISDDGQIVGDSESIILHLKTSRQMSLDDHLSAAEVATGQLMTRTFEESLYFALIYYRWVDQQGFDVIRRQLFNYLPPPLRQLGPHIARRQLKKTLWAQGMARHDSEQLAKRSARDLAAIAELHGDRQYLISDQISSFDAVGFAFLENILCPLFINPLRKAAESHQSLVDYTARMRAEINLKSTTADL